MMQLLCNGVYLDLYEDADIQFTHANPLFAFDNLQCERTTEFKLPSTPTNDSVLSLARIPAYAGIGMRRKLVAQLQAGTIVKDGYLYISMFDGTDYTAIFVTGELIGLQTIKDAGSVRDLLQYDSTITWDDSGKYSADAVSLPNLGFVDYAINTGNLNPSVSLRWLMEEAATALSATINFTRTQAQDRQRLFSIGSKYTIDETTIHLINDPNAGQDPVNLSSFLGLVDFVGVSAPLWQVTAVNALGGYEWDYGNAVLLGTDQFYQISLPYDCSITFPDDFPENYCIVTGNLLAYYAQGNLHATGTINFIGTRSFYGEVDAAGSVGYTGVPLAGQTIDIPANTPFMVTDGTGLYLPSPTSLGEVKQIEFDADQVPAYDIKVKISIDHEWEYGEDVPYNAILPDLNLVELLKMYAAITGTIINYEDGEVTFEDLDFSTYSTTKADSILKRGDVSRTFADYAQNNIVQFEGHDYVPVGQRLITQYKIDNMNIEEEKELLTIKACEGRLSPIWYNNDILKILYINRESGDDNPLDVQVIGDASTSYAKMLRIELPTIDGLQSLCTASTQINIEARMTMAEYNAITAKTLLLVDNILYIWTDRSWQNDVAKFTLAKIA